FSRTFDFIKKLSGGKELRFWLALSMMDIQKAKNDLWVSMLIPTIIALVIGIVASAVFSFYITKPVKTLIEDIAVVSKGNLDHKSDVSTNDEIGLLANKFNEMTGLLKVAHEREIQQTAMEHELSIARQIQANLLPKERFESEDVKLDALYKPSKEVGGDYYDYFSIDDDHLGIVVADVSGKGVPASIIMSMYRILLRTEAIYAKNLSSRETLIRVNEILAKDMKKGMFVTTFYMILNLKDKTLMLSSAGHNPIYYYKSGEKKMYNINPAGLALGIYSGKLFRDSLKEATITLENNDSVLAYTDGVIECTDSSYNFFGEDRLKSLFFQLAEHEPKEVVNTIFEKLCQFQGDSEQHDDITLVSLRRNK
ncbi:MAG: SpoIIE family protein phosphatase, partial [Planctomycetes bacterium]|nr:SpoIIE family protein phosphatase [Planctomycetota bacterium]